MSQDLYAYYLSPAKPDPGVEDLDSLATEFSLIASAIRQIACSCGQGDVPGVFHWAGCPLWEGLDAIYLTRRQVEREWRDE